MHYPSVDQEPLKLAQAHVDFQEKFDLDFIKLTPFDLYCVEDWGCQIKFFGTEIESPIISRYAIQKSADWLNLKVLPPIFGTLGKQLLLSSYVKKLANPESALVCD